MKHLLDGVMCFLCIVTLFILIHTVSCKYIYYLEAESFKETLDIFSGDFGTAGVNVVEEGRSYCTVFYIKISPALFSSTNIFN